MLTRSEDHTMFLKIHMLTRVMVKIVLLDSMIVNPTHREFTVVYIVLELLNDGIYYSVYMYVYLYSVEDFYVPIGHVIGVDFNSFWLPYVGGKRNYFAMLGEHTT